MMEIIEALALVVIGMFIGQSFANYRWSSNAEHPHRIEHNGRLYKVTKEDE